MPKSRKCVICEVELQSPVMLGEAKVSKSWARIHDYDGYQRREPKHIILSCLKGANVELLEPAGENWPTDYYKFFTCMKHTELD